MHANTILNICESLQISESSHKNYDKIVSILKSMKYDPSDIDYAAKSIDREGIELGVRMLMPWHQGGPKMHELISKLGDAGIK